MPRKIFQLSLTDRTTQLELTWRCLVWSAEQAGTGGAGDKSSSTQLKALDVAFGLPNGTLDRGESLGVDKNKKTRRFTPGAGVITKFSDHAYNLLTVCS